MSVSGSESIAQVVEGIRLMEQPERRRRMIERQRTYIPKDAALRICEFLKKETKA